MALAGWDVEGIEPSAQAARQACEAGYKVRNDSLETAGAPETPFDVAVGRLVLEHPHHPLAGRTQLRRWVRQRSDARRDGKGWCRTCSCRGSARHQKKNK